MDNKPVVVVDPAMEEDEWRVVPRSGGSWVQLPDGRVAAIRDVGFQWSANYQERVIRRLPTCFNREPEEPKPWEKQWHRVETPELAEPSPVNYTGTTASKVSEELEKLDAFQMEVARAQRKALERSLME